MPRSSTRPTMRAFPTLVRSRNEQRNSSASTGRTLAAGERSRLGPRPARETHRLSVLRSTLRVRLAVARPGPALSSANSALPSILPSGSMLRRRLGGLGKESRTLQCYPRAGRVPPRARGQPVTGAGPSRATGRTGLLLGCGHGSALTGQAYHSKNARRRHLARRNAETRAARCNVAAWEEAVGIARHLPLTSDPTDAVPSAPRPTGRTLSQERRLPHQHNFMRRRRKERRPRS